MQTPLTKEHSRLTRIESQDRTRRGLLDSAGQRIVEHGVTAASVRNISESAGFSQGAFYAHFSSKEAMLLEVLRDHLAERAGRFEKLVIAIEKDPRSIGSKADAIVVVAAFLKDSDPKWAVLAVELLLHAGRTPHFSGQYDEVRSVYEERLGQATKRLFEHLRLRPPCPPLQIAQGLLSMSVGFVIQGGAMLGQDRAALLIMFFAAMIEASEAVDPTQSA